MSLLRDPQVHNIALILVLAVAECASRARSDDLEAFRELRAGMGIDQVRARVGNPDRETGSGIAIDVYRMADGSEVRLGYAGRYGLIYVQRGDQELLPDGAECPRRCPELLCDAATAWRRSSARSVVGGSCGCWRRRSSCARFFRRSPP